MSGVKQGVYTSVKPTVYVDSTVCMFSYGMNTNQTLMKLRCKNATVIGPGTVYGHRLHFRYHCDITETNDQRHCVHGLIWQIHMDDLATIDEVEGYPEYYTRKRVWTRRMADPTSASTLFHCWVYHMNEQVGIEPPDENYLRLVMEGYKENNIPTKQLHEALERCNMIIEVNNG